MDMNDRRAKNEALLYRQFQFLNTRMEAYETVLSSRKAMFRALWNPKWLKAAVDAIQMALMKAHDEKMKAIVEEKKKPKLAVPKPGLTVVTALLLGLLFSGCVSKRYHDFALGEATVKIQDCEKVNRALVNEIAAKTKRLDAFNQVDEYGRLRPLRKWEGDTEGWDVDGTEEWLK